MQFPRDGTRDRFRILFHILVTKAKAVMAIPAIVRFSGVPDGPFLTQLDPRRIIDSMVPYRRRGGVGN